MRLLILHTKADGANQPLLDGYQELIRAHHPDADLVLARDDFLANAANLGGWPAWMLDIATRIDYDTGMRFFDAFVVPGRTTGKATAGILRHLADDPRPVWVLDMDDGLLKPVVGVTQVSTSVTDGWSLET